MCWSARAAIKAKLGLQEIWMADTKIDANAVFDGLIRSDELKYAKGRPTPRQRSIAVTSILPLFGPSTGCFCGLPIRRKAHSPPLPSHHSSKGCLSYKTALAMVVKLVKAAQHAWRRLEGHNQLPQDLWREIR
jgi:hypothetical protein